MRVFITSLFAHIFLNLYIGTRLWQALPRKKSWRIPAVSFIGAEMLLYGVIYIFHDFLPDSFIHFGALFCLSWLMAMVYFTIILLILDCLRLIHRHYPIYPRWVIKHYAQTKYILTCTSVVIVGSIMIKGYIHGQEKQIKEIELTVDKKNDKHRSLRIAIASDWHIGHVIQKKEVQQIVNLINAQNPDLILMPGDILDHDLHIATLQHIEDDLNQLKAPLGVYAVMGNHEYRGWPDAKLRWLEKTGIVMLRDSVVSPDSSFFLIGRDDYSQKAFRKTIHQLTYGLDKSKMLFLMDHQPETLYEATQNGIDIAVYGHTHNGQVWPHGWMIKALKPLVYGLKQIGNTTHLVTSGVGMAGPPLRIGTDSEIIIVTIHFTESEI